MMTLPTYSIIARALTSEEPLEARLEACFQVFHSALPHLDVRLTVWDGAGGTSRAFAPLGSERVRWDNARVTQVARRRQPLVLDQHSAPALPPASDCRNDSLSRKPKSLVKRNHQDHGR